MTTGCSDNVATHYIPLLTLSEASDIAQVVIAGVNLFLVFYFFYQQKRDSRLANKKSVRLQWFKELVMQPNLAVFNQFFTDIEDLRARLLATPISNDDYLEIGRLLRSNFSKFRVKFQQPLLNIDQTLYLNIKQIIEDLDTQVTTAMLDATFDFTNDAVFNDNIATHLVKAKTDILTYIINFEG
jgi:hypothetical protein